MDVYFSRNTLYCEDCVLTLARLPPNSVDMILTSPPYDNLREYDGINWNFQIFTTIAQELARVLKVGGVMVWVVGDATIKGSETFSSLRQALYFKDHCGLNAHDTMIYQRQGIPLNHKRYEQHFEYMFVFSKGRPSYFSPIRAPCIWAGKSKLNRSVSASSYEIKAAASTITNKPTQVKPDKVIGNVWQYATGGGCSTMDKIAFQHPAIFPEKLALDHIKSWSAEGALIYDPFAGSGTTLKAAYLLGRHFLGSELSPKYCQIAQERLAALSPTLLSCIQY